MNLDGLFLSEMSVDDEEPFARSATRIGVIVELLMAMG